MATISKLKPGQILYDVKRNTGLQAFNSKYSVWEVQVISVHVEENYIIASWNHNPARKMFENSVKQLRVKPPNEK